MNAVSDKKESLCLIPARGGSKGVKRKNIRLLAGVPLLVYSIKAAKDSGVFEKVYVSTEDAEIAEIAKNAGAVVIDRPAELAEDSSPMPPVFEHALQWVEQNEGIKPEYVFLLHPTSPFRTGSDIRKCYEMLKEGDCDAVMGVFKSDDPPQWTLTADKDGYLHPLFPMKDYLARRQDIPTAYFDGPIYGIRTKVFLEGQTFLAAKTRFFVIPRLRAIDIDEEIDFRFAEFIAEKKDQLEQIKDD